VESGHNNEQRFTFLLEILFIEQIKSLGVKQALGGGILDCYIN
jgi:hypothetical protein